MCWYSKNELTKYYKEHCMDESKPYNNVVKMLKLLKKNGIRILIYFYKERFR